jgi:hypothetical protein
MEEDKFVSSAARALMFYDRLGIASSTASIALNYASCDLAPRMSEPGGNVESQRFGFVVLRNSLCSWVFIVGLCVVRILMIHMREHMLHIYPLYFYSDGTVKYDGFSTPRIDKTISKKTLYSSSRGYNARISRETKPHRLRDSTRLLSHTLFRLTLCLVFRMLSHNDSHSRILTRLLPYPKMMLHFRIVG